MEFSLASACSSDAELSFQLFERIRDVDGFKGTIRYIGPVASAKNADDIWLGVEWDSKTRGKHNGSCIDSSGTIIRYFDCEMGCGSFIKPNLAFQGQKFTEALKERYISLDAPDVAPDSIVPDAFVQTAKGKSKSIQFVGERKIRERQQIDVVTKISIRSDTVATADEDIAKIASHFTEVDLQENLIWSWKEVAKLVIQMPILDTLLLQSNRMQPLTLNVLESFPTHAFHNLRVLALNHCSLRSYTEIQALQGILPNIEELYLAGNNFQDIPLYTSSIISIPQADTNTDTDTSNMSTEALSGFERLRVLDLSGCKIELWGQILMFGRLPVLQELRLDSNAISTIQIAPEGFFKSLSQLTLGSCSISEWSDVDALATYGELHSLRLSHVPLLKGKSSSEARAEVVGRMPLLILFNGSTISAKERFDAERMYLRRTLRTLSELKNRAAHGEVDAQALLAGFSVYHPRLEELSARFAGDAVMVTTNTAGGSLATEMINVYLHNVSSNSGNSEPLLKRLPASLTTSKLKLMIKQLFGIAPQIQVLSFRNDKESIPSPLDDGDVALSYIGIAENADIFVNES
eukprot:gene1141-2208_t